MPPLMVGRVSSGLRLSSSRENDAADKVQPCDESKPGDLAALHSLKDDDLAGRRVVAESVPVLSRYSSLHHYAGQKLCQWSGVA